MTDTSLGATTFTLKRVRELLGLSRTTVSGLIAAGFVSPVRGARNEHRFSFQDLLVLRTAHALEQARIPPRRILRSLARLKADLPAELPLTGLRITAVGADVAVRDPSGQWQAESGQRLMDFEVSAIDGTVSFMPVTAPPPPPSAIDCFKRGQALEATDLVAAEAAYRHALGLDPRHAGSYVNLGALLCETRRADEALALYDRASALAGEEPLVHFNRAIALEDTGRLAEAVTAYRRVLALDPTVADAHFNLALLLERQDDPKGALRHFNAYRRLSQGEGA